MSNVWEFSSRETAEFMVGTWKYRFDDGTFPEDFWEWLIDNTHVLKEFIELAFEAKTHGYGHWSARGISEVMRWRRATRERGQNALKVNDHSTPGLARLAMKLRPELDGFFSTRTPPAKDQARRLIDGRLYGESRVGT